MMTRVYNLSVKRGLTKVLLTKTVGNYSSRLSSTSERLDEHSIRHAAKSALENRTGQMCL